MPVGVMTDADALGLNHADNDRSANLHSRELNRSCVSLDRDRNARAVLAVERRHTGFNFGKFSSEILIGDFGDGFINAYDTSGRFHGQLDDTTGKMIQIPRFGRSFSALLMVQVPMSSTSRQVPTARRTVFLVRRHRAISSAPRATKNPPEHWFRRVSLIRYKAVTSCH
jgi:hypothetical protein